MILAKGKLWKTEKQDEILSGLEAYINRVRATKTLERETVIRAVDQLGKRIANGEFDETIARFADGEDAAYYKSMAVAAMNREALETRCALELGDPSPVQIGAIRAELRPLGTLFHIAAGNVDGLPALSVLEGLLTGNFNILKLPSTDSGLTVEIVQELIKIEPVLADFVAVFDTPSSDAAAMRKMAEMADGIVLWGGEEATRAVRSFAPAGVKLIEWGHRLGFAYISGYQDKEKELDALAEHIARTRQLFCSSCQVIYLDSDRMEDCHVFAREFLPYLEQAMERHPITDIGQAATLSVRAMCRRMDEAVTGKVETDGARYEGEDCSVTVCRDSALELSELYGSVLVKRLPKKHLLPVLRQAKGKLQTAGLICEAEKRAELTDLLLRAGINRVTTAGNLSESFPGESHDGEYPLRRFVRVVNVETE